MGSNCTCYNCKERVIGCHAKCNLYKKYKQTLEIIKENKNMDKDRFTTHKWKGVD